MNKQILSGAVLAAALTVVTLAGLRCKSLGTQTSALKEDGAAGDQVVARAQECLQALGIPNVQLPPMSCLAGTEVPITWTANAGTAGGAAPEPTALTSATFPAWFSLDARHEPNPKCDAPQWLEEACYPYDLGQKVDIGVPNVDVVLNCRQKYFPKKTGAAGTVVADYKNAGMSKAERLADLKRVLADPAATAADKQEAWDFAMMFNDLGLIFRDKTTGKACYFTIFYGEGSTQKYFGGWLPAPDQDGTTRRLPTADEFRAQLGVTLGSDYADIAQNPFVDPAQLAKPARDVYLPEVGPSCVGCHSLGGFKWSPFIDQAGILPSPRRPSNQTTDLPFLPVGADQVQAFMMHKHVEVAVAGTGGTPTGECTRCHRITSQIADPYSPGSTARSCNTMAYWAMGQYGSAHVKDVTTDAGLNMPYMPDGNGRTLDDYNRHFGPYLSQIKCCCQHPTAAGCIWRRYGPTADSVDQSWRTGPAADLEEQWKVGSEAALNCAAPAAPGGAVAPGTGTPGSAPGGTSPATVPTTGPDAGVEPTGDTGA